MNVLKFYTEVSGLCINVDNTRAVWIGSMRNSGLVMCPEFNVKWDNGPFKLLGVTLSVNLETVFDLNYVPKIDAIKMLLAIWSKRLLSPLGRITVVRHWHYQH